MMIKLFRGEVADDEGSFVVSECLILIGSIKKCW